MNIASWIIVAILIVWVAFAIKNMFFKKKKESRTPSRPQPTSTELTLPDDDAYKIDMPTCGGCDKQHCADCPILNRDIPMPIIHELK